MPEPIWERPEYRAAVARARDALGVERLVLAIHDASFPASDDDLGRGTPYSDAGRRFVRFVGRLGFTGLQLGPQGMTTKDNPSPYDGTLFAANEISLALGDLLPLAQLRRLQSERPAGAVERAVHKFAHSATTEGIDWLYRNQAEHLAPEVDPWVRSQGSWLERDSTFAALEAAHGTDKWRAWPRQLDRMLYGRTTTMALERRAEMRQRQHQAVARFHLGQYLCFQQHMELRRLTQRRGLQLYGDLQIGISHRDAWSYRSLLLDDYLMGAPPSRTNPRGQPWAYRVLDPSQYGDEVAAFMCARIDLLLERCDGIRVDHPHGLVCPWVYKTGRDAFGAVQRGARLFDSPDLPDHPQLTGWAIARPEQLDRSLRRWDDGWVRELDEDQVDRYARLFGLLISALQSRGKAVPDLVCEVLSTWPHPLRRVMNRYRLGRFCVTQKANLDDPQDVYRSENVSANDWIMVGNHDTPPLMSVTKGWVGTRMMERRARYLAQRLIPIPSERGGFVSWLTAAPENMGTAMLAELFASPARNVSIFFPDLLGVTQIYNRPGEMNDDNWSLRVSPDYARRYARMRGSGGALDLPAAMAMALRADPERALKNAELLAQLDHLSSPHVLEATPL
jgi:4-alpha-glucanotransferase